MFGIFLKFLDFFFYFAHLSSIFTEGWVGVKKTELWKDSCILATHLQLENCEEL